MFTETTKTGDFPQVNIKEYQEKYGPIQEWQDDEAKLFYGTAKKINPCTFFASQASKIDCTYEGPSRLAEDPRF
jgi:hypothetical protein